MITMPKLLPWLARKAGVSMDKATTMWREAMSDESLQARFAQDPDAVYRSIVERLRAMAAPEKTMNTMNGKPAPAAGFSRRGDTAVNLHASLGLKTA